MNSQVVILQLALLGVILESDVGLKKIGWFRIARPVIVVLAIGPSYLTSLPSTGHNLTFLGICLVVGVALGLFAVSPLLVSVARVTGYRSHWAKIRGKPGIATIASRAGVGYASVWIVVCVLRLLFAYGSQHWFAHGLATFLHTNRISGDGLTDGLIFFSIAMDLARSAGLLVRRRRVRHSLPPEATATGGPGYAERASGALAHGVQLAESGAEVAGVVVAAVLEDRDNRRRGRRRRL